MILVLMGILNNKITGGRVDNAKMMPVTMHFTMYLKLKILRLEKSL